MAFNMSARRSMFSIFSRATEPPFLPLRTGFLPLMAPLGMAYTSRMLPTRVRRTDDELCIQMLVPRFKEAEVRVEAADGTLTVSGKRHEQESEEGMHLFDTFNTPLRFLQRMHIPEGVDIGRMTKSVEDGVLTLRLPFASPAAAQEALPKQESQQQLDGSQQQQSQQEEATKAVSAESKGKDDQSQQKQTSRRRQQQRGDVATTSQHPSSVSASPSGDTALMSALDNMAWPPKMRTEEKDGRVVHTLQLPPEVTKEHLALNVREDCVYVTVRHHITRKNEGYEMSSMSEYVTSVDIPHGTRPGDINAKFENGALTLSMPAKPAVGSAATPNIPIE